MLTPVASELFILFIGVSLMLIQFIGDQFIYLGQFRVLGTAFVTMSMHQAKRVRIRRNLNQRLPDQRLQMDGVSYVC